MVNQSDERYSLWRALCEQRNASVLTPNSAARHNVWCCPLQWEDDFSLGSGLCGSVGVPYHEKFECVPVPPDHPAL